MLKLTTNANLPLEEKNYLNTHNVVGKEREKERKQCDAMCAIEALLHRKRYLMLRCYQAAVQCNV